MMNTTHPNMMLLVLHEVMDIGAKIMSITTITIATHMIYPVVWFLPKFLSFSTLGSTMNSDHYTL